MEDRKVPLVIMLDGVRTVIGEAIVAADGTFRAEITNDGLAGAIINERYETGDMYLSFNGLYAMEQYPKFERTPQLHLSETGDSFPQIRKNLIIDELPKRLPPICVCFLQLPCNLHPGEQVDDAPE